jgi:beta-glucanase (GH16 family)
MVSPEHDLDTISDPLPEAGEPLSQPEGQPMSLRKKILIGVAGLAVIGASVYLAETSGADNNSAHVAAPTEITASNNTLMVTRDFAAKPTWVQDFGKTANGGINQAYWRFDQGTGGPTDPRWGNNEAEYYTDNLDNVQIKDGSLDITALKQAYRGSDYTSGRIKTEGKVDVEYGKIDVVAELPGGAGTWPAIWMLSQKNIYYYSGPKNDSLRYLNPGEIDIMEEIGAQPDTVTSSAQSRSYNPTDNTERIKTHTVPDATTAFNDYGLEWTPTQLVFTVDGKPYHIVNKQPGDTYKAWPYDQPFYLLLNDALGGTYGGQDSGQYPPNGINNAALPATFKIRSITYSKYIGPDASS